MYPNSIWFKDYAILGDDIVIANSAVASEYVKLCDSLGVEIGLAKSLISKTGKALEFAKRTFVNLTDVSAVPFTEYWVSVQMTSAAVEFGKKYLLNPAQFLRLHGAGWRNLSAHNSAFTKMGKRWRTLLLAYISPKGVSPKGMLDFLLSKSINKISLLKTDTQELIYASFIKNLIQGLLDKIHPDLPVWSQVRKLVEVNKHYSYTRPSKQDIMHWKSFTDIVINDQPNKFGRVKSVASQYKVIKPILEEISNTVYRTAFLDVLPDVAKLRRDLEALLEAPSVDIASLTDLNSSIDNLLDTLENLPVATDDLYWRRAETQVKIRQFKLATSWAQARTLTTVTRPNVAKSKLDLKPKS